MKNKKTILVTGGAGFIGSNLCRKLLLDKNNYVICFDNLFTGSLNNIDDLINNNRFTFVRGDVKDPFFFECDQIYHLACPASPVHYQINPIDTAKTCFLGALNVLEIATKNKATVLLSSTSEVYGEPLIHPQIESYRGNVNPDGIRACYDEGKRISETLFFDYHRTFGTNIKVVRIFNTYGPGMRDDDGRVVSNFITQALAGKNITIYGDGSQTRSFCFVDDLIDGLVKMMNSDKCFVGPCNLGNPKEFTVFELASLIIQKIKTSSKIVFLPLPSDDPTRRKPNIDLAIKTLGWEPKTQLSLGLEKTIDYFSKKEAKQ